jgi:hypothetical protein
MRICNAFGLKILLFHSDRHLLARRDYCSIHFYYNISLLIIDISSFYFSISLAAN